MRRFSCIISVANIIASLSDKLLPIAIEFLQKTLITLSEAVTSALALV